MRLAFPTELLGTVRQPTSRGRRPGGLGVFGCSGLVLIVGVIGVLMGLVFLSRSTPGEVSVPGTLAVVAGSASIKVAGRPDFIMAPTPTSVRPGDRVKTSPSAIVSIRFPDGSDVWLSGDSDVVLDHSLMNKAGVLSLAAVEQIRGHALYSLAVRPGTHLQALTKVVSYDVSRGQFEVCVEADGTEWVRVFSGEVITLPGLSVTLRAGDQRFYDPVAAPLGQAQAIDEDPADPLVEVQRARSAAASILTTPGTEQTFTSTALMRRGMTVTAGVYGTGGGDLVAVLSYPGSGLELTLTGPSGVVVHAEGAAPLYATINGAPPGYYTAQVSGTQVSDTGLAYALTVQTTSACATGGGNGYARVFLSGSDLAQSFKVSNTHLEQIGLVAAGPEAWVGASVSVPGGRLQLTGILDAETANSELRVLALDYNGVPVPSRALGAIQGKPPRGRHLPVERLYSCNGGIAIEGRQ